MNVSLIGPLASAKAKRKPKAKTAGGKQATLFGLKKGMPPPKAITGESLDSLETEEDFEETMRDDPSSGILEESMVSVLLLTQGYAR